MADETLEIFIRQYLESQPDGEVTFTWQGGEPTLMGIPFLEKAVALQEMYKRPGQTIQNAIQTNGYSSHLTFKIHLSFLIIFF